MRITVEFDSEEEFKARIKNPRGAKGGNDEGDPERNNITHTAPAPLMPPQAAPQSFNPAPAPQFTTPAGTAFPNHTQIADSAVQALVTRITTRMDALASSGSPEQMLTWFRGRFGQEGANATLDQIKTSFLPKSSVASLEETAKLIGA